MTAHPERISNALLGVLPSHERERLRPLLEPVELKPRQILHHWGTPMEQVYFIERGLVSVTARISRETAVEVWLIGREGMTGVPVLFGGDHAPPHRRVVQVGGSALRPSRRAGAGTGTTASAGCATRASWSRP